jgi:hypothetical protein
VSTYGEYIEGAGDQPGQYIVRGANRSRLWRRFWTWTWRIALVILVLLIALMIRFMPESWNPFTATQSQTSQELLPAGNEPPPAAGGATATASPNDQGDQTDRTRTQIIAVPGGSGRDGVDGAPGRDGADGAPGADGATGANGADGGINNGQGDSSVMACDDSIGVSLRSAWNAGAFTLDRLILTGVSETCEGSYFHLILLDESGASLADIEVPSIHVVSRQAVVSAADYPVFTTIESARLSRVVMEIAS